MKKNNTKKNTVTITKILKILTIVGIVIVTGFILNFIYKNLYSVSMKYSQEINLQSSNKSNLINIKKIDKILEEVKNKKNPEHGDITRDPFN